MNIMSSFMFVGVVQTIKKACVKSKNVVSLSLESILLSGNVCDMCDLFSRELTFVFS